MGRGRESFFVRPVLKNSLLRIHASVAGTASQPWRMTRGSVFVARGLQNFSIPRAYLFGSVGVCQKLRPILLNEEEAALRQYVASLMVILWHRLDWPIPDRIAILPLQKKNRFFQEIGEAFSHMFDRRLSEEFQLKWTRPFEWGIKRKKDDLLENQTILLIDFEFSLNRSRQAKHELGLAMSQSIFLLTVYEDGPFYTAVVDRSKCRGHDPVF